MLESITDLGRNVFLCLILLACMVVSVQIASGNRKKLAREAFIVGVLALMVGLQYYYLLSVVNYLPATRFFIYNINLVRQDCTRSSKGGKRPDGSQQSYDLNPCFCLKQYNTCIQTSTGASYNGTCPTDGTYSCRNILTGNEFGPYISANRNCQGGMGTSCSWQEPCYPCELSKVTAFQVDRCRTCSTDFTGDCNFIPGVGPYCYESPTSKQVIPCKICCTEPGYLIQNGTCY